MIQSVRNVNMVDSNFKLPSTLSEFVERALCREARATVHSLDGRTGGQESPPDRQPKSENPCPRTHIRPSEAPDLNPGTQQPQPVA